jgi:hypothetical protein
MKIAPFACQADPDGLTLYLFHSTFSLLSIFPSLFLPLINFFLPSTPQETQAFARW